jgi:glyoxylase I family protein
VIRVLAVNHVSLLVSDTTRALGFYHGLLGIPLEASRPELGFPGAFLRLGDVQIHLLELPAAGVRGTLPAHAGRDRHLALDVADLEVARAALAAAGIDCTLSRSGRRALFCRDPDGNGIELVERSAG